MDDAGGDADVELPLGAAALVDSALAAALTDEALAAALVDEALAAALTDEALAAALTDEALGADEVASVRVSERHATRVATQATTASDEKRRRRAPTDLLADASDRCPAAKRCAITGSAGAPISLPERGWAPKNAAARVRGFLRARFGIIRLLATARVHLFRYLERWPRSPVGGAMVARAPAAPSRGITRRGLSAARGAVRHSQAAVFFDGRERGM